MWFSSKPSQSPQSTAQPSEFADPAAASSSPASMDSDSVKRAFMRQIQVESNITNARQLMEKISENCFEKCVPNPGGSLSASEQTCVTQCMEKYMAAWNQVHSTYHRRIQQEVGNNSLGV